MTLNMQRHFLLLFVGIQGFPWASLVAQLGKNPPAIRKTWVQSLDREDPLKKGKATHSRILAWRIPWAVQKESDMTEQLTLYFQGILGG